MPGPFDLGLPRLPPRIGRSVYDDLRPGDRLAHTRAGANVTLAGRDPGRHTHIGSPGQHTHVVTGSHEERDERSTKSSRSTGDEDLGHAPTIVGS